MAVDPEKRSLYSRPELFDFHGVSMTHYFTDNWEKVQNFQARPDDILIATYPKAGTTWVSYILDLLYFGQTFPERQTAIPLYERVPFLEFTAPPFMIGTVFTMMYRVAPLIFTLNIGTEQADKLSTSPRIIKTHLPVQFVPKSFWEQNSRIVYIARNAKDNAVSFFHFDRMNKFEPEAGDWSSFLQRFTQGKMLFGSWYDHVTSWWEKTQTFSNLHYMLYEDLITDTGREIDQLCSFLGLSPSAEEKERVRAGTQFDQMKNDKMANYSSIPEMDFKVSPFMRKGKVGDWKNHFTVAQNEQFDDDYKTKMKDPTLQIRSEV